MSSSNGKTSHTGETDAAELKKALATGAVKEKGSSSVAGEYEARCTHMYT